MPQRTIRRILTLLALAFVSGTIALAQSSTAPRIHVTPPRNTWEYAQSVGSSKGTLLVVTKDQPQRRQTCHLRPFNADELVCSRRNGARTYLRQQVVALILPGDGHSMLLRVFSAIGLSEFGAAIWGSVVLAGTCPACGVAAGIATVLYFGIAALFIEGGQQQDRLLYLAPGQKLTGKLGAIKF